MTTAEAIAKLEALSDEKVRARNTRNGAHDNQFGVKLGEIRKVAKELKSDHELGMALWQTGNIDARLLATLLVKPEAISADEMDEMVRSETFPQIADWLNSYVVKKHPENEELRQRWLATDHAMAARSGWFLTTERIMRSPEGLDLSAILDRIESEMGSVAPETQWTMNTSLAEIGIRFPEHRDRAISIGESLGVFRDYPVSKGCTSPFAPIWIEEMVKRQG